jgi:hypothetical protein
MKLRFEYDEDKDIQCLVGKGKSSINSQKPTKQYQELIAKYGENPNTLECAAFITAYLDRNKIDLQKRRDELQSDWNLISSDFQNRANSIFGVTINADITAYLTISSRCPYSIKNDYFYVSLGASHPRKIIMHELWHFYTWYGLGVEEEKRIGSYKYNELKEVLTVLINIECSDLLPHGVLDQGYPRHQEIRNQALEYWYKDRNLRNLWSHLGLLA